MVSGIAAIGFAILSQLITLVDDDNRVYFIAIAVATSIVLVFLIALLVNWSLCKFIILPIEQFSECVSGTRDERPSTILPELDELFTVVKTQMSEIEEQSVTPGSRKVSFQVQSNTDNKRTASIIDKLPSIMSALRKSSLKATGKKKIHTRGVRTYWQKIQKMISDWIQEPVIVCALKIRYPCVFTDDCERLIPKVHACIFNKFSEACHKYNGTFEWSGNDTAIISWKEHFMGSLARFVSTCTEFLQELQSQYEETFNWSMGISSGSARCGVIQACGQNFSICFSPCRNEAIALADFAVECGAPVLVHGSVSFDPTEAQVLKLLMYPAFELVIDTKNSKVVVSQIRTRPLPTNFNKVWQLIESEDMKASATEISLLASHYPENAFIAWLNAHLKVVWNGQREWTFAYHETKHVIECVVKEDEAVDTIGRLKKKANTEMLSHLISNASPKATGSPRISFCAQEQILPPKLLEKSRSRSSMTVSRKSTFLGGSFAALGAQGKALSFQHQPGGDFESELSAFVDYFVWQVRDLLGDNNVMQQVYTESFLGDDVVEMFKDEINISSDLCVQVCELVRTKCSCFQSILGVNTPFNAGRFIYKFTEDISDALPPEVTSWNSVRIQSMLNAHKKEQEELQGKGNRTIIFEKRRIKDTGFKNDLQEQEDLADRRLAVIMFVYSYLKFSLLIVNMVVIPFYIGFNIEYGKEIATVQWLADVLVYWPSVKVEWMRQRYEQPIDRLKKIIIPIMGCFPVELVAVAVDSSYLWSPLFRANRLLNIFSYGILFDTCRFDAVVHQTLLVVIKYMSLVLLMLHLIASNFHFIVFTLYSEEYFAVSNFSELPLGHRYATCFNWAVQALVGYSCPFPRTDPQFTVVLLSQLLGLAGWSCFIAYVQAIIRSLNPSHREYEHLVQDVKEYFEGNRVPEYFTEEVLTYLRTLWNTMRMYSTEQFDFLLQEQTDSVVLSSTWLLPTEIRTEFCIYLNRHVVERVAWLTDIDDTLFITDFVTRLKPFIFTDGVPIIAESSDASNFYIIIQGTVLIKYKSKTVEFGAGEFFGEIPPLFAVPNPIVATSKGIVHCYGVTNSEFVTTVENHPHCLTGLLQIAEQHLADCRGDGANRETFSQRRRKSKSIFDSFELPSVSSEGSIVHGSPTTSPHAVESSGLKYKIDVDIPNDESDPPFVFGVSANR